MPSTPPPGTSDRARRHTHPRLPVAGTRLAVRSCGHDATGPRPAGDRATDDRATDDRATDDPVASRVAEVHALHDALAALPALTPGPEADDLFSRLVSLATAPCAGPVAAAVLATPSVDRIRPELRRLCGAGETELERAWSRRIAAADDPGAELERFPYADNYRDLTRLEHQAVSAQAARPLRRVLFVGSGPLPLTSLLLAREYGLEVDNLDVDRSAVSLGREVTAALGVPGLRFTHGDVLSTEALGGYDLVCLAALVGLDPAAKSRMLAHLCRHVDPGALVLARSAHSLRSLLYPVLDVDDLAGLVPLSVLHPYTDVVNSVVVARTPHRASTEIRTG